MIRASVLIVTASLGVCALCSGKAAAQQPGVYLDLPTVETSVTAVQGRPSPGMQQSLWLATDAYELAHFGIGEGLGLGSGVQWRETVSRIAIGAADIALIQLPPGLAWQHEEWHRAVLSHRGISSFNDVYDFDFTKSAIAVSHVSDAGLVRLKRDHPADLVRLETAGFEANYELATNLEKTQFFHRTRSWNVVALWSLYLSNILYLQTCAGKEADSLTDEMNQSDGANVAKRDFTGADCTGWTYDLFRPDEPYAARGVHPSGVGINRYRRFSDLTSAEKDYVRAERDLSLLNLIDPALLGFTDFKAGAMRWNGHVRYMPTSFGSTLDLDAFLAHGQHNLFATLHGYRNRDHMFPGLTLEMIRLPVGSPWGYPQLTLGLKASAWLQPENQRFLQSTAAPGGQVAARVGVAVSKLAEPYVEVDAKTAGWVAGNVHLDPAVVVRAGLVCMAF
ncbi:MAG: hypothetical protein HY898_36970 [Deltaproteobacteria bacterium]|nr:hypothetical protein [Deltaproteobacteria bacterium]